MRHKLPLYALVYRAHSSRGPHTPKGWKHSLRQDTSLMAFKLNGNAAVLVSYQ